MKKSYIKSPAQKLTENQIDIAKATLDSESNGFVQGLNILGGLANMAGSNIMSKGLAKGETGFLAENAGNLQSLLNLLGAANSTFAYGGTVPVEVEGNEVGETPNGKVLKFKGPKHEKGGIKTNLPGGTEIFSDRIEVDDETLAKRKLKRERKEKKFSGDDNISKNTLKRVKTANQLQEAEDQKLQELVKLLGEDNIKKFALGGTVPDIKDFITMLQGGISLNPNIESDNIPSLATPSINPSTPKQNINMPNVTLGDALGIFGNIFQANSAYQNTLANRAGDTSNINAFENFGLDALETNDEAKGLATQIRDKQLQDLELNRSTLSTRNRQGARGINTMRALDLAGSIAANQGESDIQANYASQLLGLLQQESQLENMRDNAVMSGEAQRDLADRQDRDNFYTNKGTNLTDIGRAISQTGKSMNDINSRDAQGNLINQLFDYVNFDPLTGTISQKENVNLVGDSTQVQFTNFENQENYKNINNPQTNKPFTKTEWNKLNNTEKMNLFTRYKIK